VKLYDIGPKKKNKTSSIDIGMNDRRRKGIFFSLALQPPEALASFPVS
jgi:hypothetical protein